MTTQDFAQLLVEEVCLLQPVNHLQVHTLRDFISWLADPKAKLTEGVSRAHLEHLGEMLKNALPQLEINLPLQEESDCHDRKATSLLLEILFARTRHYLKVIHSINSIAANPNVIWSVYQVARDDRDLAANHADGAEKWANGVVAQIEQRMKQNEMTWSPDQKAATYQRVLTDASRTKPSFQP